jgi:opacity protein-like surface antigen
MTYLARHEERKKRATMEGLGYRGGIDGLGRRGLSLGSFMKKWMLLGLSALGAAGGAWAQGIAGSGAASEASGRAGDANRTIGAMASPNTFHDFPGAHGQNAFFAGFAESKFIATEFAVPRFGAPAASAALGVSAPVPPAVSRRIENDKWQLGLGFTYVKFRSSAIHANMFGLNTSVTYFTNDWFGVEGNITAAAGEKVFVDDRTKYVGFTGGPKIVMRRRRWEPWAHALLGMAHVNPQLAGVSKNGLAMQLGGGAEYAAWQQISVRLEGDWVLTRLYSQTQNNFQLVTGFFLHF